MVSEDRNLLLVLKSSGIADSEPDLGSNLMSSFLDMLLESNTIPSKIICMGTGIFLTTSGSPVERQMNKFTESGTVVLSCGTCLDYCGRRNMLIAGQATTMRDTVQAMVEYERMISP